MDAADWETVNDLFHRALDEPPERRAAFVDRSCADRPRLRDEVLSLLAAHEDAAGFLSPSHGPARTRHDQDSPSGDWAEAGHEAIDQSLVGQQVGQYRIVRSLGEGGMGVVYLAEDTRLGRAVALKALAPRFTQDEGRRERLRREARAAAALTDPGIATVYALEEFDSRLYIVGEYIPGETLRDEVHRGRLPIALVLDTALGIARALAAAHERGIVHRDLKPENLIRTPGGVVKILDFGLARFNDVPQPPALTGDGTILGTPAYMSPEQIRGHAVDFRSDLFSFGVVLYELASGAHPFAATDVASTIAKILEAEPVRLADRVVSLPAETGALGALDDIVQTCLRKDAGARYASTRALIGALEEARAAFPGGRGVAFGSRAVLPRYVGSDEQDPAYGREDDPAYGRGAGQVPSRGPSTSGPDSSLGWWQFHQAAASVFDGALLVALWRAHHSLPGLPGLLLFVAGLVAAIVAVTLRLHLWFAVRALPAQWPRQHRQTGTWIRLADWLFVGVLLVAGAMVLTTRPTLAVLLIGSAVAGLLSSAVIEPATTRAALGGQASGRSAEASRY